MRGDHASATNQPRIADGKHLQAELPLDEFSFYDRPQLCLHGLIVEENLRASDEVGQLSGNRLQGRTDRVRNLSDEPPCRHIHEMATIERTEIDVYRPSLE